MRINNLNKDNLHPYKISATIAQNIVLYISIHLYDYNGKPTHFRKSGLEQENKMEKNRLLLVSFILGLVYALYIVSYFLGIGATNVTGALASTLVTPHMVFIVLAVIFNGLGYFKNKRGFALAGAVLYAVSILLFMWYFMFVIIQMILSFVGFVQLGKNS